MLAFEEARARILAHVEPVGQERIPVADALGRVLRETLTADVPLPAFDHSAMDGYALATKSLVSGPPYSLPVTGESRTGGAVSPLAAGTAQRIFTGARLPDGADSVLMQEDTERDGDFLRFQKHPSAGDNVRRAGEDLAVGGVALAAGTRLGPGQIGLAAALDRAHLLVSRKPRVSILCTGDELRAPGDPPRPGSIPESNGFALAALVEQVGGDPRVLPYARDDDDDTRAKIRDALAGADLCLTVGGVSVGDHDRVRPALEAEGAVLDFWRVAIRPGKPLAFGRAKTTWVLGLPGNPVSAQVTCVLFGVPLLRALTGDARVLPSLHRAQLRRSVRQKPGRMAFLRATLDGAWVTPLENQASGAATSMAWANALVLVPSEVEELAEGTLVDVLPLSEL